MWSLVSFTRRVMLLLALVVGLLGLAWPLNQASAKATKTLAIYFVDTEGGAATLIVTPQGESLLVDSGNPGERDAGRIARVAREVAGLKQIDHYLTTHWHTDHVGGIADLAKLIPVKRFYDHGVPAPLPRDINAKQIGAYQQLAQGQSVVLKPGVEIKLRSAGAGPKLRLRVLAADGLVLGEAPGAPQIRACRHGDAHVAKPEDTSDNARSVVFLLTYGNFKFFDGGDLTWNVEHKLACPTNLAGRVDVFQVNHHGLDTSNNPVLVQALQPRVAVINNGPRKGGEARTFATLKAVPGLEAIFQLHRNVRTGAADNTPPAFIANDEEACQAEFIKLTVDERGRSYTVAVPSKGTVKTFQTK